MARDELIFGFHAAAAAIRNHPERVLALWIDKTRRDARMREVLALAERHGLKVQPVGAAGLSKHVGSVRHQGVAVHYRPPPARSESDLEVILNAAQTPPLVLVLDGVSDPHNLGACLRTAQAAGVHVVIAPKDRAAKITPVVRHVASGAAEQVPFVAVSNLARTLGALRARGLWVFGTDASAKPCLYEQDLTGPVALVLGGEGSGLRRLSRDLCDVVVSLPMAGEAQSLNVSVAAGVCLFEVVRQRRQ